ncbi:MAG TPA: amidase [Methylocystis sp.]|nr:amidase [Methylocystis sp.]
MEKGINALVAALDVSGREGGPLAGRRFVVKDNIAVAGLVSGNGHPAYAETHAPAELSAPAVERLLAGGANLVGKTQMDEMAYSLLGANPHYGAPVNVKAPDRHPGGSSSGSAVAVAANLADFALGTDTAGSCRAPAAFCGVCGFRPSHGALPQDGLVPLAPSFDTLGWFARDAATLTAVGDALLPKDPFEARFDEGLLAAEACAACPPEEETLFRSALDGLGGAVPLREIAFAEEFWREALGHFRNFQAFEAHRSHGAWIATTKPQFGAGVAERFAYAATVTEEQRQAAAAFRAEARLRVEAAFGASSFLVLPTAPFFAPPLDESASSLDNKRYAMMRLFLLASFFGLPQVSLPLATNGRPPLGLSLIGPRWSDRALLAFAQKIAATLRPATA